MIDALIYDMGNVLVRWDPHALALAGSEDPADASVLEKALFASPDWIKGDLGLFGPEEMFAAARLRVPARLEPAEEARIYAGSAAFHKEYYIHLYHFFQYGSQESPGGFT